MDVNGWHPGTFLVETDTLTGTLESGPSTVSMVLPMTDSTVGELDLVLLGSDSDSLFIEATAGSSSVDLITNYPTFFFYGSAFTVVEDERDLDGALVTLTAIDEDGTFRGSGHFERAGATGTELELVQTWRPPPHAMMEVLSGASLDITEVHLVQWRPSPAAGDWPPTEPSSICTLVGGDYCDPLDVDCHPCSNPKDPVPAATQCTDDLDNDDDDGIDIDGHGSADPDTMCDHASSCDPSYPNDYPEHTHTRESGKYYAIFGDVVYCTEHKLDWQVIAHNRALFMREVFHASTSNSAYNDFVNQIGVDAVRWFAAKCWIMATPEDARACRAPLGSCGVFDSGDHVYPYRGLGSARSESDDYFLKLADDYEHAVNLSYPYTPIDYPADFVHLMVYHGKTILDYGAEDQGWGGTTVTAGFGSIINGAWEDIFSPLLAQTASPHETGHLFGCVHCDAELYDDGWDVMVTEAAADSCAEDVKNDQAKRFNGVCAANLLNGLNSRTAPGGGPQFGY